MKVLFVSSGNSRQGISPIIKNQGESLFNQGIDIHYFTIKGRGITGYLSNVKPLKKYLRQNKFNIIHAHYSLSAFVASLAGAKPLIVSLMGSDVKSKKYFKIVIKIFNFFSWNRIIVKSQDMKVALGIDKVELIPNGVNLDRFKSMNQMECKKRLSWNTSKKQILFAANPDRPEKNFQLALDAYNTLQEKNVALKVLDNVPNDLMPVYFNAADVVVLTSLWEGSPNVIKEAMVCNIPIVSTNVGDVKEVIGKTKGCYISTFEPEDVAEKIQKALDFGKRTTGREDIKHLESGVIAKRIIEVYNKVLDKK
jgi:glycosyltransferase involved in cell wall biosynthesis